MVGALGAADGDDAFLGVAERVAVDVGLDLGQEVVGLGQRAARQDHHLRIVGMDGGHDGGAEVAGELLHDLLRHAIAGIDALDQRAEGDAAGVVLVGAR